MSLRGIDLNLVPILQALLRDASVTGAARTLGMSQPAVSHALGRLRHLFDDPLLVKVGREMRLTPRAERLRLHADASCSSILSLLAKEAFDPAQLTRQFTIAAPDYLALLIGTELIETLQRVAPGVTVAFVDANFSLREDTIAGKIDLSMLAYLPRLFEGLSCERGYSEALVCVAPEGHPLSSSAKVGRSELSRYPRIDITGAAEHLRLPPTDQGVQEPVMIGASQMMVLPLLAARTGAITVIPLALAKLMAELVPLAIMNIDEPAFEMCLVWSPTEDEEPAQRWLRSVVGSILGRHCPHGEPSRQPFSARMPTS